MQVSYALGVLQSGRSFVVGYSATGDTNYPSIVQQRASSCPASTSTAQLHVITSTSSGALADSTACTWASAFYPSVANPQLQQVFGAMVAGPDAGDAYVPVRSSNDTTIFMQDQVAFTGTLAGLGATGTSLRSCELEHGVWQKYVTGSTKLGA